MANIITCNDKNSFVWGDGCMGWHLTENQALSIIKEIMPPNTREVKHYHLKAHQVFYIIEGEAQFDIDGKKIIVRPGEAVSNAGEKHYIINSIDKNLIFLVISTPSTANDRINVTEK